MTKLGVISIATNKYIEYWKDFIDSTQGKFFCSDTITFHLFTDQIPNASNFKATIPSINFCFHEIPSLGWPDATLLRYSIINENSHHFEEDYLIYMDSDMRVICQTPQSIIEVFSKDMMTLIEHPGFYRPKFPDNFKIYLYSPRLLLSDIKKIMTMGALGTWETNLKSTAVVARGKRKKYYCGGVWGGPKNLFLELCKSLDKSVNSDLSNGIIAKWHDESHLNMWASTHKINSLAPNYCYDPTYVNLRKLSGIIEAVKKQNNPIGNHYE